MALLNGLSLPQDFLDDIAVIEEINHALKTKSISTSCKQWISCKAEECINRCISKMEQYRNEAYQTDCERYKSVLCTRISIIIEAMKGFQLLIEKNIEKCEGIQNLPLISDAVLQAKDLIKEVTKESRLLASNFLMYAYKKHIVSNISDNQVTIITGNSEYCKNINVPLYLFKEYGLIVSCQPYHVSATALRAQFNKKLGNPCGKMENNYQEQLEKEWLKGGVVFTMAHKILSEDALLQCASVIIVDEAHDRFLETEILFAKLRMLLKQGADTKVVVMATCQDPSIFCNYFACISQKTVISLPDVSYPRRIIWAKSKLEVKDDYVKKTVTAIETIKDGDVLVFLPSERDIANACSLVQKDKFSIYQVHEGTNGDTLLELFDVNECSKRKLIFSTQCSETSLYFPTVQHIIDCGVTIRKEYCPKKRPFLTTCLISKDRAALRATSSAGLKDGTCYRMYNKESFGEFEESMRQITHGIEPSHLMLRLLRFNPTDLEDIRLISPVDEDIYHEASSELEKMNVVRNFSLTPLGKEIVKLPFHPSHGKLLVLGRERGVHYPAAVFVAVLMLNGSLFERKQGGDGLKEMKRKMLFFSHINGDTFTALNVYCRWLSVKAKSNEKEEEKWCAENGISPKAMGILHSSVNKICGKCELEQPEEFNEISIEETELLQEIVYESLKNNLCVYSGHPRAGYRSVFHDGMEVFLHPSSVLNYCEVKLRKYLVYDHVEESYLRFMVGATAINERLIQNDIKFEELAIDLQEIEDKTLASVTVESVSSKLIEQHFGKTDLKTIEERIKADIRCDCVIIDPPDTLQRAVSLYTFPKYVHEAEGRLRSYIQNALDEMKHEERCFPLTTNGRPTLNILLGSGGRVKLLTAETMTTESGYKKCTSEKSSGESTQFSIHLSWSRTKGKRKAYVSFPHSYFPVARAKLAMSSIKINDTVVDIQLSQTSPDEFCITGLDKSVDRETLTNAILRRLPEGARIEQCVINDGSSSDVEEIKTRLTKFCETYINPENVHIVVPDSMSKTVKVFLNFDNLQDCIMIKHKLKKQTYNSLPVKTIYVFRSVWFLPTAAVELMENNITKTFDDFKNHAKLLPKFRKKDPFRFEISKLEGQSTRLKILTNDIEIMNVLKIISTPFREGEVLRCERTGNLNKLLSPGGKVWLTRLQAETDSYVNLDRRTALFHIYGSPSACEKARNRILTFLKDAISEDVKTVDLSQATSTRSVLTALVQKYGVDLDVFVTQCELISIDLDIRNCKLNLHGSLESIEKAEETLKQLINELDLELTSSFEKSEELCPVCLCPPSPSSQSYRLQCCGHLYCSVCILLLMKLSSIPIQCLKQYCNEEIPVVDIDAVLGKDQKLINAIINSSIKAYVDENSPHVLYCNTPGCPMVYDKRKIAADNTWACPVCLSEICALCRSLAHPGYSCATVSEMKGSQDTYLKIWMANKPNLRKNCPKCTTSIEKVGGCNSMTCATCKAHFCWKCLSVFFSDKLVHNHTRQCKVVCRLAQMQNEDEK